MLMYVAELPSGAQVSFMASSLERAHIIAAKRWNTPDYLVWTQAEDEEFDRQMAAADRWERRSDRARELHEFEQHAQDCYADSLNY